MSIDPLLGVTLGALSLASLAALAAEALRRFSRSELEDICERRQRLDRFSEVMRRHGPAALGADLLSAVGAGVFVAALFSLVMVPPAARQPVETTIAAGAIAGELGAAIFRTIK